MDAGEGRNINGESPASTRIMVFTNYRDSAEEIVRILRRNEPMVRPHVFVGQAASKNSAGMDQAKQLEITHKFKTGVYNTLVATSIGEEGLDIGEIDLAICYDSKASPIRMLQRMGRTGRKRAGNIVLLQMRGKEVDDFEKAKDNYERMQEMIAKGDKFNFHTARSRRILPRDVALIVDKRVVDIPLENSQLEPPIPKKGRGKILKKPAKNFFMPDGVSTGFVTASRLDGDDEDAEGNIRPRAKPTRKPAKAKTVEVIDEPARWPALTEVLLTDTQERDLQQTYGQVYDDDEDQIITAPALNKHPDRQRVLSRTKFVPHSQRTRDFVDTMARIHRIDESRVAEKERRRGSWNPERDDVSLILVDDEENAPAVAAMARKQPTKAAKKARSRIASNHNGFRMSSDAMEGDGSSPPPPDPHMDLRSQAIDLGTQDTSGEEEAEEDGASEMDSELENFVVGDEEEVSEHNGSSQRMPDSSLPVEVSIRKGTKFYVSQEARGEDSEDEGGEEEDDLPDVGMLTGKPAMTTATPPARKGQNRKRQRRVVEESDSDD